MLCPGQYREMVWQIKVSSEMNAPLFQLYRKTGQLEGVIALIESWELECVNNLIDIGYCA